MLTGSAVPIHFVKDSELYRYVLYTWYVQKDIALVQISMISSGRRPASTIYIEHNSIQSEPVNNDHCLSLQICNALKVGGLFWWYRTELKEDSHLWQCSGAYVWIQNPSMHELAHGRRSLHAGQTCFPNSLAPSSSQKTSLTQSRQKKVLRISKVSYTYIYIKIGGKDTWARGDPGNCSQPLSALLVVAYQVVLHDVQHSSSS